MQTHEMLDQLNEFNQIVTEINKRIQKRSQEIMQECVATNSRQLENFAKLKSPSDMLEMQKNFYKDSQEKVAAFSQEVVQMTLDNYADLSKLVQASMNIFNPLRQQTSPKPATVNQPSVKSKE